MLYIVYRIDEYTKFISLSIFQVMIFSTLHSMNSSSSTKCITYKDKRLGTGIILVSGIDYLPSLLYTGKQMY